MKTFCNNSLVPSTPVLIRIITGCLIFLSYCILAHPTKGCDRSSLALDSVVCEGSNYRIYLDLCLGGGITGAARGADDDTRTMAFGFFSSAPGFSVLNYSPASITGDSSGITMGSALTGPVFGFQEGVAYLDPSAPTGFICVSSVNQCGNIHTQCDQYSFLVNTLPDSIRLFGAEANGNAVGGCYPNSDMIINISQFASTADAGLDTLICRGDTITLGGNLTPPINPGNTSFLWSPPSHLNDDTLSNPLAWPQSTTIYSLLASAKIGCLTAMDSVTVTVDTACVWPGDCNYDLIANYLDILPIGLAYNSAGPVRPTQGINWVGHPAFDWSGTFINGPNYKHADCNGNGLVNLPDVSAIFANYGQTHTGNRVQSTHGNGIYFQIIPDSAMAGDSIWIMVGLGTQAAPEDSVYGIGFQLFYPPALVDSGSVVIKYDNSWLGTDSVDMITLEMDLYQSGVVEVGMTRIDHIDRTGFGEICRIGIAMQDDISAKVEEIISRIAIMTLDGVVMTAADERMSILSGETDSIVVWQNGSLPVIWQDFHGRALPEGIQLDWVTATEINADHFQVERSFPGETFSAIGSSIDAAGNTSESQHYEFLDPAPRKGENIYRLLQADLDGSISYSPVISVTFAGSEEISFTAPPVFQNDQLSFTVSNPISQRIHFQLFDMQGKQLTQQLDQLEEGSHTMLFNCETLCAGVYLFHMKTASTQVTYKIVRQ